MADKTQVVIAKTAVAKSYDDKAGKYAAACADAVIAKTLGASGRLEVVRAAKKGAEGFSVMPSIEALAFDEKKGTLSAAVRIVLATLPKKAMFGFASGKGSIAGVQKPGKGDLDALMKAVAADAAKTARKTLDSRVKSG